MMTKQGCEGVMMRKKGGLTIRFGLEAVPEFGDRGNEPVGHFLSRGNVHGGGEGVV